MHRSPGFRTDRFVLRSEKSIDTVRRIGFFLVLLGLLFPSEAKALDLKDRVGAPALPDRILDSMRGGFSVGDMNFNFSFRSVTWVNNVLISETDLTLANNVITSLQNVINNPALKELGLVPSSGSTASGGSSAVTQKTGPGASSINTVMNTSATGSGHSAPGTGSQTLPEVSVVTPPPTGSGSGNRTLSGPTTTLVSVGSGNSGVAGNALSNAGSLTTVIQNDANNVLIQHVTQLNGIIGNLGPTTHTTNMILRFNQAATLGSILSRF